ncbi:MAG: hypothetical protein AAF975_09315, partial [Spirochaetota bacterium]
PEGLENSESGELGRIFVKDYFPRLSGSSFPGKGSWLVMRVFLEPLGEEDFRRIRILYNAYRETLGSLEDSVMQRSGDYPQEEGHLVGSQVAYLFDADPPELKPLGPPMLGAQIRQRPASVCCRLSFTPEPYAGRKLHPQYSTGKSLEILRGYLRDADSSNDHLVLPALSRLRQRDTDADTGFQIAELVFYYYLMYRPDLCDEFLASQKNQWGLNRSAESWRDLWQIRLPRIWASIKAVRFRYGWESRHLLPG